MPSSITEPIGAAGVIPRPDAATLAAAEALRAEFAVAGFVELQALLPAAAIAFVRDAARAALDLRGRRRDLRMAATDGSPRRYRLVGRDDLRATRPALADLYRAPGLLDLLARAAGEAVLPVPYEPEEFIATRFERPGDTHGWHWDDYAFALIWVGAAPAAAAEGGSLERVAGVAWNKDAPRIASHLAARTPVRAHLAAGTVYLLRSDTTLHRVTPLRGNGPREVMCFSYASRADFSRRITHETIEALA